MLIDWFTVGAQVLNFVVLVWLLKRFLYQPVLDAIAAREGRIAKQIADADAARRDALAQRQTFEHKSSAFDAERAALMEQAARDAATERERLMAAARQAADDARQKQQKALSDEAAQMRQTLVDGVRREVVEITRRALADLASASLEERLAEVFVRRLGELAGADRAQFAESFTAAGSHAVVRSAFEMPEAQRGAIRAAVGACLGAQIPVDFECTPALVCGIELVGPGQKLGWNIDQYLGALEREIAGFAAAPPSIASAG